MLSGGRDFLSNGIHLNLIEAAADPAAESWRNINAMNDLVLAILTTTDRLTIAALYGSAGAGGVMLALAADRVFARDGIVLNPHYKGMGGLYGSEYWTYSLPKRVGPEQGHGIDRAVSADQRARGAGDRPDRRRHPSRMTSATAPSVGSASRSPASRKTSPRSPRYAAWLAQKQATRDEDERCKPLQHYRSDGAGGDEEELLGRGSQLSPGAEPPSCASSRAPAT